MLKNIIIIESGEISLKVHYKPLTDINDEPLVKIEAESKQFEGNYEEEKINYQESYEVKDNFEVNPLSYFSIKGEDPEKQLLENNHPSSSSLYQCENYHLSDNEIIDKPLNSFVLSNPVQVNPPQLCSNCNLFSGDIFHNSHIFCFTCLYTAYTSTMNAILIKIKEKKISELPNKFVLRCIDNECNIPLKIPMYLILKSVLDKMESEWKEIAINFMPYFDGIKTAFSICKCENTIGNIEHVVLGCKCLRNMNYNN